MPAGGAHDRAREERIRAILAEHAERTVPTGGLEQIRARAAARRPWWRRLLSRQAAPRPYLMPAVQAAVKAAVRDVLARPHTCDPRPDPLFPDDVRCRICGRRPESRTAAPGSDPGTAATAERLEGHTAMTTLPITSPDEAQTAAALALAHLTRMGLPRIEWRITRDGVLCGHVDFKARDEAARDAVRAYARVLRATVVPSQGRGERTEYLHVETVGTYWGATVRVWTHVDVRATSPYASFGGTR